MTYATRWARCWSLVGAVGVGLSFLVWQPLSVLTVFLTASLCAGILLVLMAPAAGSHNPMPALRWSRICARAGVAGAAVVALAAVSTALPAVALPLALAAIGTCPPVVEQLRRWRPLVHDGPPADGATSEEPPDPVASAPSWPDPAEQSLEETRAAAREMTDRELCREWRHSFVVLQSARSPQALARVVARRQVFLDELERRSPTALQAWLDSGARAAGGPERFLTRRRDDQTDAA